MTMVFKGKVNYYYEFIYSQEILVWEGQHEQHTNRRGKDQQRRSPQLD
jgi:hypothetical protein